MSVDRRLRDGLTSSADALDPPVAAALDIVRHRARRRRRRVLVARLVAVAATVGLIAAGTPAVLDRLDLLGKEVPPAEAPELPGVYVVDVADSEPARQDGMVGRWLVDLRPDGTVGLEPPDGYEGITSGVSYQIEDDQLRTNAFVFDRCDVEADPVGSYQLRRTATTLEFTVLDDGCEARRLLFSGQPWREPVNGR